MPFRIALCITDLEIGGAERCLTELAVRLDRNRFHPVVYCLAPESALLEQSFVAALRAANVEVHCLGARRTWEFFRVVRQLATLFADHHPHLVQSFLFHGNLVGRIAARRAGVGRVVSGIRVAEPRRWHLWLDRVTDRLVDRHVCVSHGVAHFAQATGGLPLKKLAVIPNGVDPSRFGDRTRGAAAKTVAALGIPAGRKLVTFVGRLDRQKGLSWLLDTAATWLPQIPDCDLVLVGKGPEQQRLRRKCRRSGLSERVHFVGWRANIPEILGASCLLVLPSRWEGMPNVVLEAMASRLPIVATEVEGVREVLGPAADEQTVPPGDSSSFCSTLLRLVQDSHTALRIGELNYHRAADHFSLDRMVAAYQDLWKRLLAPRN